MKVLKINNTPTETVNSEQAFKAIRLKTNMGSINKNLKRDVLELRKTLPDNSEAKTQKYFGGYDPYSSNTPQMNDGDGWKMLAIIGAGLGALALM